MAIGAVSLVLWQPLTGGSSPLSPAATGSVGSEPGGTAGAAPASEDVAALRRAIGDAQTSAESARSDLSRRLARLEDLFPNGLAALEAAQAEYRATRDERDEMNRLYRRSIADTTMLALDEVDDLLNFAARKLGTEAPVASALALVEAARVRIAKREVAALAPIVVALDADLVALRQAAERSPLAAADKLLRLSYTIDELPFESTTIDPAAKAAPAPVPGSKAVTQAASADATSTAASGTSDAGEQPSWWNRVASRSASLVDLERAKGDAGELVRVTRVGASDASTLPPTARYYVIENLRLRLLNARLSVMLHDTAGFDANRQLAAKWLEEHFDSRVPSVKATRDALDELAGWRDTRNTPSVTRSRDAIAHVRSTLPKVALQSSAGPVRPGNVAAVVGAAPMTGQSPAASPVSTTTTNTEAR